MIFRDCLPLSAVNEEGLKDFFLIKIRKFPLETQQDCESYNSMIKKRTELHISVNKLDYVYLLPTHRLPEQQISSQQ